MAEPSDEAIAQRLVDATESVYGLLALGVENRWSDVWDLLGTHTADEAPEIIYAAIRLYAGELVKLVGHGRASELVRARITELREV